MYVAGEASNAGDVVLSGIADRLQRKSVVVALVPVDDLEAGALISMLGVRSSVFQTDSFSVS